MALLCTYHHELLHQGAFLIEEEADGALRFVTADRRTIPRGGYRLEDFVDDELEAAVQACRRSEPDVSAYLAWHLERGLRSLAYVER